MKSNEVRQFLAKLDDIDFRYLRIQINVANDARNIVHEFKLTKERFCELMDIKPSVYKKYMQGGFNYSLIDFAKLNQVRYKLSTEQIAKEIEENHNFLAK
jgi:hypothetical protein